MSVLIYGEKGSCNQIATSFELRAVSCLSWEITTQNLTNFVGSKQVKPRSITLQMTIIELTKLAARSLWLAASSGCIKKKINALLNPGAPFPSNDCSLIIPEPK